MKSSMQLMTLDDMNGHWKTKDGRGYLVIDKDNCMVQLFVDHKQILSEQLTFEYIQEDVERKLCNSYTISKSIILWMIIPKEGNIVLKINDDKVEFSR